MSTISDPPHLLQKENSMRSRPHDSDRRQTSTPSPKSGPVRGAQRRWLLLLGAATCLALMIGVAYWLFKGQTNNSSLVFYNVEPTDLNISVTERGNLESQSDLRVLCEVDDVEGDGVSGTPIVWIVENGASVKKDDLIVELDSANHMNRLDSQILDVEEARSVYIQAKVTFENQITQNETLMAEAGLKVELDELALQQYEDEEGGTFQIELQDVELNIQEAKASEMIQQTNLNGVEQLYKLGYRSSGELAQARLETLKAERSLATALSRKKELVEYQYKMKRMELEGGLASAKRALQQVKRDNDAQYAQDEARMVAAEESLKKEEELLARYKSQVEKCKIFAPQDGMVAYATGRSRYYREEIRPGAAVRPRQPILTLPNLQRMQVRTTIHESVLDQITKDLPVSIRVDAFPGKSYSGTVQSVAVLPDQGGWLSSDTKVYATIITIDEKVEQLKPGMTAVAEIRVDYLKDVLAIPVQSVIQVQNDTWCYIESAGGVERRELELGRTNDKFVEIRSGIQAGERVVLNPNAITDGRNESGNDQEDDPADVELASS